jgi:hypothetical protein
MPVPPDKVCKSLPIDACVKSTYSLCCYGTAALKAISSFGAVPDSKLRVRALTCYGYMYIGDADVQVQW